MKNKNYHYCFLAVSAIIGLNAVADQAYSEKNPREGQESIDLVIQKSYPISYVACKELGVKKMNSEQEIKSFNNDINELMNKLDILSEDQSKSFWELSIAFSKKYQHSFPVGYIQNKLLSSAHIAPKCKIDITLSSEDEAEAKKINFLCDQFLKKAFLLAIGRQRNLKESADALLTQAILVGLEADFYANTTPGVSLYSIDQKRKASALCSSFVEKHQVMYKEMTESQKKAIEYIFKTKKLVNKSFDRIAKNQHIRPTNKKEIDDVRDCANKMSKLFFDKYCPLQIQYEYIYNVWLLRTIAVAEKDTNLELVANGILTDISQHAFHQVARRWGTEALKTVQDHAPRRFLAGSICIDKNNKPIGVDEDGDGKPDYPYDPKDYE